MVRFPFFLKRLLFSALLVALISAVFPQHTALAAPAWTAAASMNTARKFHTATLLPNGQVLVAGGSSTIDTYTLDPIASTELYDPYADTWTASASMNIVRAGHTAVLLPDGRVLVAGGLDQYGYLGDEGGTSAELYDPLTNQWALAAPMASARSFHTMTLLPDGKVLVVGGGTASAEIYDPLTDAWTSTPEMSTSRREHTATLLPSGKVLVIGGTSADGNLASAEIYDPAANNWSLAAPMSAGRHWHTATLLPDGRVLVAGSYFIYHGSPIVEVYDPETNTWTAGDNLEIYRSIHTATLLPNGQVLVSGGSYYASYRSSAELFDPLTGQWTTTASMADNRDAHTATLLADGRVLVAGGYAQGNPTITRASAEIYGDPAAASWSAAAPLPAARARHTATLLFNGKLLVAGGWTTGNVYLDGAQAYDPVANSWEAAGTLNIGRRYHTATLLPDGKVLVAGGLTVGDAALNSSEVYDPATNAWTNAGSMHQAHSLHTATLLPDGQVLVTGGYGDSAERYDPALDLWTAAAPMSAARFGHTAVLLPDGRVLVAGGQNGGGFLASVEVYDPATNAWSPLASLNTPRVYHSMSLLPDGRVLVVGGYDGSYVAGAEIFDPASNTWTVVAPLIAARNGHTATLLPNGQVIVAGGYGPAGYVTLTEVYDTGTNTWTPVAPQDPIHSSYSATLLPNGKLLAVGGETSGGGFTASADLYDLGLGFDEAWRPSVSAAPASLQLGNALSLTGAGFRGYKNAEASGGETGSSAGNIPLVQIQRIDNQQVVWAQPADFDPLSYRSQPLAGLPPGPVAVTIFVNGIPSLSRVMVLTPASTVTTLRSSQNPSTPGQVVTFTATVSAAAGKPSGSVTFKEGGAVLGQVVLAEGLAEFSTSALQPGLHTITAEYSGDPFNLGSVSAEMVQANQVYVFVPLSRR